MAEKARSTPTTSAVPLVDLEVGGKLPFDVQTHLRLNDKYVLVAKAGEPWSETKVRKMRELKLDAMVPIDELPAYYAYAADVMKRAVLQREDPEKAARLRAMAGDLFRSLLQELYRQQRTNPESEQTHARKILDLLIADATIPWLGRLLAARAQQPPFSHAGMSGYDGVCLALMSGEPDWRSVAISGFFHDLGFDALPAELRQKTVTDYTPEEWATYSGYPEESAKKLVAIEAEVPAEVLTNIRGHLQRDWSQVSSGARLLALASRFDQLTRVQGKQIPLSPDQALRQINREPRFDPALIAHLTSLFPDGTPS